MPAPLFLRDLRRGVADRDEHREHGGRALRLGGAHREERVQERAVQAEIAGRDEVAEVIEDGADLRARGRLVEPAERRIERRADLEQPLQDLRAQRRRRHVPPVAPSTSRRWYTDRASGVRCASAMPDGRRAGASSSSTTSRWFATRSGRSSSEEGYVVDIAVDGDDALDRVHAARPDAILLDLMMPGMNGRQFLQALRDDPARTRTCPC